MKGVELGKVNGGFHEAFTGAGLCDSSGDDIGVIGIERIGRWVTGMRPFCNHQDISRIDGIIESLLMQNIADGFFCLGIGDVYGKGFFLG